MPTKQALSIVVLISGSGSNLQAIIDAIESQQLNAEIKAVISNQPEAYGLIRASKAGIKTHTLNHRDYNDRESFDQALIKLIDQHQPDYVVLAGFMRILTENFVTHYQYRMLNIHPSLLPEFRGLNTHQRAIDAGRSEHGVSIHFVTNELDSGPMVIQAMVKVETSDTAETLADKVHQQEHIIYPMVIQWLAEQRLKFINEHLVFDQQSLRKPLIWDNAHLMNPNS
ncbi:MAG: phosphoribosylglycinamide formyltransferase [Gammaproteobacteria bacterium]|nr:phosphoribosylglycinamide formyltransferase [Gammaproteobacteria bacterium]